MPINRNTATEIEGPALACRFQGFDRLEELRVAALIGACAALYPHVKTHKSLETARLQKNADAAATTTFGKACINDNSAPLAVAKLSEEHAFLIHNNDCPPVGTAVLILPNHACPAANLSVGLLALGEPGGARTIKTEGVLSWS